jgi:hypothetical protein
MDDRVQPSAQGGIAEDDRTEPLAVNSAVRAGYSGAEGLGDLRQLGRARGNHLAGRHVRVDDHRPVIGQPPRYLALAGPGAPVSPTRSTAPSVRQEAQVKQHTGQPLRAESAGCHGLFRPKVPAAETFGPLAGPKSQHRLVISRRYRPVTGRSHLAIAIDPAVPARDRQP